MTRAARLAERLQDALGDAYTLEGSELAGGGMSRLYRAATAQGERVVVKALPPELASVVGATRFRREMGYAAQLRHPHILPVLEAGGRDGLLYYVMPFVEGETLAARLERGGALPVREATAVLRTIADALAHAHEMGVLHRDLKPANILLDGERAYLADFGIARALGPDGIAGSEDRITAPGLAPGTPGYMAPEQISGDTEPDASADQYSLGVVGYEMLAGRPPFTEISLPALRRAHLTQSAPPLRSLRPDAPEGVAAAIDRALAKRRADRFPSVAAFRDAVASAVEEAETASAGSPPARGRSFLMIIAAALLLALAFLFANSGG